MTETTPKTMQLQPSHWRELALLNVSQLHGFLSQVPAVMESGQSGMTDELITRIESHINEQRAFLRAWRLARIPQAAASQPQEAQQQANGAHEPEVKKKGGWPKGKKRTPRVQATQQ